MKVWVKYFIGVVLGVVIALLYPEDSSIASSVLNFIQELSIRFGKYSLFPFLFFTVSLGTYKLKESKKMFKIVLATVSLILIFSFLLTTIGVLSAMVVGFPRVPIFQEENALASSLNISEAFLRMLPPNAFLSFSESVFILPICIFAALIGSTCTVDKLNFRPIIQLFDNLSRLFYAVMAFFVEMFAIALIAITAYWVIEFKNLIINRTFLRFSLLFFIDFLLIVLVIYPIILKIFCRKVNPYRIIYASIAPLLAAFFSGDANVTLNVLFRHANESLGVRRRITSFVLPMFSMFGKAGSALVLAVSFLIIMTSYSSLGMKSFGEVAYLVLLSVLLSMCISHRSREGVYVALSVICATYGNGFESGFLILHPAIFIIASVATAIDAITALLCTYIIAYHSEMANTRELKFFI